MISFGIMQGRLTPSKGRGIQFFPFDNWKQEFYDASELGLNEIEWIVDIDDLDYNSSIKENINPLFDKKKGGSSYVSEIISETRVKVHSVCWDYFMRKPFFKVVQKSEKEIVRKENIEKFQKTIIAMKEIGANLLEIPLVDESSIKNIEEELMVLDFIRECCDISEDYNIFVGLETDLPAKKFKEFLDCVSKKNVRANYDSGNSSGLGYDAREELTTFGTYIQNVHIKDRALGAGTKVLGTGSCDFDKVFSTLKEIGYINSFILQAARSQDGEEENNIRSQLRFIKNYLKKYKFDEI